MVGTILLAQMLDIKAAMVEAHQVVMVQEHHQDMEELQHQEVVDITLEEALDMEHLEAAIQAVAAAGLAAAGGYTYGSAAGGGSGYTGSLTDAQNVLGGASTVNDAQNGHGQAKITYVP